jgi:hypothetical protein
MLLPLMAVSARCPEAFCIDAVADHDRRDTRITPFQTIPIGPSVYKEQI